MTDLKNEHAVVIGKCLTFAEIEELLAAERERCAVVAVRLGAEASRFSSAHEGRPQAEYVRGRSEAAQQVAEMIRKLPPRSV
jgi:hypothetical protein